MRACGNGEWPLASTTCAPPASMLGDMARSTQIESRGEPGNRAREPQPVSGVTSHHAIAAQAGLRERYSRIWPGTGESRRPPKGLNLEDGNTMTTNLAPQPDRQSIDESSYGLATLCDALFASCMQSSQRPSAGDVRAAIADTLARRDAAHCVAQVAQEFGDHPEIAIIRMHWAISAVTAAYGDGVAEGAPRPDGAGGEPAPASPPAIAGQRTVTAETCVRWRDR